jgi:long-chain acyl-CoA synthetase
MAQAVHVPVHAPLTAEQVAYQVHDSGARIAFASTPEQVVKIEAARDGATSELQIYAFDGASSSAADFQSLMDSVSASNCQDVERRALDAMSPESLATILYTSGTTGEPKGVMLNQRNLVSNTIASIEKLGFDDEDLRLNFLPLSHIYARTCDLYTWIGAGTQLALASSRETVVADCAAVKPTVLNAVPYFFDRVQRTLVEKGADQQPDALRQVFGGRIRYCFSGGAALPEHTFDFYRERGVPILQGYGLTETSPVISVSTETQLRRGASGIPIADVEVVIAEDGEILTRGPNVMVGYYKRPDATAEVMRDGWFCTGDLGRIDDDGFLFITGRKKEIIVTSGGKNIAPVLLESLLSQDPLILQALVVGDSRNYLTALLVPDPDELEKEIQRRGIAVTSAEEALVHPRVVELYETRVAAQLQSLSQYEQVRKFALLNRGFTIESGELTPKMSLRRREIEQNFAEQIEEMYGSGQRK